MSSSPQKLEHSRVVLEELTSKWTLLVLNELCNEPMRFNALRRALPDVTQKALTQCLRRLEASGFISRTVVSLSPVAVIYEISPLGRSLEPHLQAILKWADEHREEIQAAKYRYSSD
ncbi:winged helix-turn-helix transcriptional regulator [Celerinatantimonas yamalensis]|uniref:Helix-turn-helix domain-containing protein n=1 Tax=Celerinatantimonas yamalensis TaxID=559956 RepID=A0ABW9GBW5_9GAMM